MKIKKLDIKNTVLIVVNYYKIHEEADKILYKGNYHKGLKKNSNSTPRQISSPRWSHIKNLQAKIAQRIK